MLDFYYDIDRQLFDKVFVYPLIKQFIEYVNASGVNPLVEKTKLEYLEILFNRIFINDLGGISSTINPDRRNRQIEWKEKEREIREKFSGYISNINRYDLKYIRGSAVSSSCQLVKETRIEHILSLLIRKRSSLVKSVYNDKNQRPIKVNNINSWEDLKINGISKEEIDQRTFTIKSFFGERMNRSNFRARGLNAIDYFEAIKYKELIEEEMSIREDDIFSDL
ncbi:hypothetical protein ACQKOM_25095 [Peribacillus frigoritolerans]|uniref:hypothetical protein n=1 Tax=Peribacillus frigoritolerans TaxID=450367 RepID=UPI003D01ECB1